MHLATPDEQNADTEDTFWRRLLYRWFVEYNPLYLLSASLVLGGMLLLSRGLAHAGSAHGELGVAAIAELYAITLIGGAALLTRIGHRRPAVMLSLLTVVYQCDLTLHTETCAHLGSVGIWAAAAWAGLFVGKLRALAWAMKIHISRRATTSATLGAAGLAALPLLMSSVDRRASTALVVLWLSGLVLLYRPGSVTSLVALDGWGHTVLRRAVRASWLVAALLFTSHVLFWSAHHRIDLATIVCVLPLLATRWIRGEAPVWGVIGATLVLFALRLPAGFALAALVSGLVLAARAAAAARAPETTDGKRPPPRAATMPYRMPGDGEDPSAVVAPRQPVDPEAVIPGGRAAMVRLASGAVFALYLSIWTCRWSGGPWPAHVLPLDLLFAAAVVIGVWKVRVRIALVPLAAVAAHLVVQSRLIPAPRTHLEWGGAAIGLGFVILLASLATSYWLRPPRSVARIGTGSDARGAVRGEARPPGT